MPRVRPAKSARRRSDPCEATGGAPTRRPNRKKKIALPSCVRHASISGSDIWHATPAIHRIKRCVASPRQVRSLPSRPHNFGSILMAKAKVKHFFTKVVGVTHRNSDGSSRQTIIGQCAPGEQLQLHHDEKNGSSGISGAGIEDNGRPAVTWC